MHVEMCWMYRVASYISDDPCEMIRVATGNASSSWDRGMGELVDLSNCPNAPKANSYFFHRVKPSLAHCGTWILQVLMLHAVWSLKTWVQGQSRQCEQQWTTWWTAATAGGSDRIWAWRWEESIQQYARDWTQENQKHRTHPLFVYVCFFQQSLSFSFMADTVQRKYMWYDVISEPLANLISSEPVHFRRSLGTAPCRSAGGSWARLDCVWRPRPMQQ